MGSEARTLTEENAGDLAQWCGGRLVIVHDALDYNKTFPAINVPVGDGVQRAAVGDLIIHNNDGSFRIFKN